MPTISTPWRKNQGPCSANCITLRAWPLNTRSNQSRTRWSNCSPAFPGATRKDAVWDWASAVQNSGSFNVQRSTFDCSTFEVRGSMFDVRCLLVPAAPGYKYYGFDVAD